MTDQNQTIKGPLIRSITKTSNFERCLGNSVVFLAIEQTFSKKEHQRTSHASSQNDEHSEDLKMRQSYYWRVIS